jgi:peptide/nickel transport system permease protein
MKALLNRWSFWCLLAIILLALFGAGLFDGPPEREVASAFSKPLWLDRTLPPGMELRLGQSAPAAELDWSHGAPAGFSVKIAGGESNPDRYVRWTTPDGKSFNLSPLRRGAEVDGRDISFKRSLGLPPFGDAAAAIFPVKGIYRAEITGEGDWEGEVIIRMEGGRWGLLGTDQRGRDIAALFVAGIRVSLLVGIFATLIATFLGASLGLAAGYLGGWVDAVIMRGVDLLLSIPLLPILMALAALWGKGLWQLILILSVFSWMGSARTIRALTLSLRDAQYIEDLRGIGAPPGYILRRHLLPETLPVLLASMTLGVPGAILSEAGLSFLGLSDPRVISWGRMLHEAQSFGAFTAGAWWMLLPPGLGIALLCLVFLDLGKYLEERIDPRLRGGTAP